MLSARGRKPSSTLCRQLKNTQSTYNVRVHNPFFLLNTMTTQEALKKLITFLKESAGDLELESVFADLDTKRLVLVDVSEHRTKTADLIAPYTDEVDRIFSQYINNNGVYVGPRRFDIDGVAVTVGPGETDSFGWLTGRVKMTVPTNEGPIEFTTYFG